MNPWLDDGDVRLYHGDALEQLALMPSESVQCIVTSPPFWGLRDYGTPGQIGLEETPDAWCARLVAVMREARRVLRSDGVCWIEVGDTYASSGPQTERSSASTLHQWKNGGRRPAAEAGIAVSAARQRPDDIKPKDLVGAPWLLAFALRADGWYLRSDTIWARPNPMPESVTDRPTKAHSYVFLLSKSARYFYDADAIREAHDDKAGGIDRFGKVGSAGGYQPDNAGNAEIPMARNSAIATNGRAYNPAGRNARSVWSIPTEPTPFAHFATFPQALVERCIRAGTSEHGACSECGAPWRRITEKHAEPHWKGGNKGRGVGDASGMTDMSHMERFNWRVETTGWEPSCECWAASPLRHNAESHLEARPETSVPQPVPCVVLDPFMGSGTTALVARRLGRHAIGIELNAEYLQIAAERLQQPTLWSQPVEQA